MASTEDEDDILIEDFDDEIEKLLSRRRNKPCLRRSLHHAPEFVQRLNSFEEVKAGSTATFQCRFSAFPKATVKWFKDDEDITEDSRFQFTEDKDGTLKVTITDCDKNDEGAYKCKTENPEGVASSTGYLSVTGKIEDKPLSKQPRKTQSDHMISAPPPLRSIKEQKSLEEREAEVIAQQPPSPLQDFMKNVYQNQTWPRSFNAYTEGRRKDDAENEEEEVQDEDSDTSVESQDGFTHVTFDAGLNEDVFVDDVTEPPLVDGDVIVSAQRCASKTGENADKTNSGKSSQRNGNLPAMESKQSNLLLSARLRSSLQDLRDFSGVHLDLQKLFFLAFVTGMSSYAAATGVSPLSFVLIIASVSLLTFIFIQLKQAFQ